MWALVGTLVAMLLGALASGRSWRVAGGIAFAGALATAGLSLRGIANGAGPWPGFAPPGGTPMLIVDAFSYFFMLLVGVFLVCIIGMAHLGRASMLPESQVRRRDPVEFLVLLVGSAFGMGLMVCSTNLLMILLAVETASLPSYALVGFRKQHRLAAEASMKYVLFGAVTSAVMIYGTSLLYGQFHTLDLGRIGRGMALQAASDSGLSLLATVSLVAFIVGVAFKISAVPFHFWCPDVFEGASIEVTTWLSVASKAAGLGLLLRVLSVLAAGLDSPSTLRTVTTTIAVMAAITCTVGNLSAFRQNNLKRLLAYSSIAHAGYMLMAAALTWRPPYGDGSVAHPAFSAVTFYLAVYLLMNLGAFGVVALVYWTTGKETIDGLRGLWRRSPLLTVMMVACLFSLVGLPPLGGFMAKWWLLAALFDDGLVWLVVVAVLNTLISLYYYARIAYAMCFVDDGQPAVKPAVSGQIVVTLCAVGLLLAGTLWANRLKVFSDGRSTNLYAMTQAEGTP